MPDIVSKSAFAGLVGKAPSAVSNWIARGILTGDALTPNGKINVVIAHAQLRDRLNPRRSQIGAGDGPTEPESQSLIDQQRLQAIEERELRLRRLRAEEEARRGRYTLTENVRREHGRRLAELIASIEQWLISDLPPRLNLDREAIATLRQEWRRFRERQADRAAAEAASLPEFIADDPEAGAPEAAK